MSTQLKALFAVVLVSFFGSTSGVASKVLLLHLSPFTIAFFRFLVASLILLPIFLRHRPTTQSSYGKLLILSLLSTVNILGFYIGLQFTTANAAAMIYGALPLTVLFSEKLLLKEPISQKKLLGVIVGFIGVVIIILFSQQTDVTHTNNTLGNLIIFGAMISWSLYTVGSRHLTINHKAAPLTIMSFSIFCSCIIFGILTAMTTPKELFPLTKVTRLDAVLILHLGVFVTVAMYGLYQWVIKHASATFASLSNYLLPIFGITLAYVTLGETINLIFIIGCIFVLCGIFITTGTQPFLTLGAYLKKSVMGRY